MAEIYQEKPVVKVVMLKGQDGEEKLINQANGSGLSFWIGTQEEYDAIPETALINNCVYYITDDTREGLRAALNDLDMKVDNNYVSLDTRIGKIENIVTNTSGYNDFNNDAKEFLSDISYITAVKKCGFVFIDIFLSFSANFGTGQNFSILTNPIFKPLNIQYADYPRFATGRFVNVARTYGNNKAHIIVSQTGTIAIEAITDITISDTLQISFVYPAKEV